MNKKLSEALDHISDRHIAEAASAKSRRRYQIPAVIAAILALVLVISLLIQPLMPGTSGNVTLSSQFLVAEPQYPEMAPYPVDYDEDRSNAWSNQQRELHNQPEGYADSLDPYFAAITGQLLSNTDGKNAACSPVNIYLALAMLAETTDGDSRQQILDLLGADSIKDLRTQAEHVWKGHYNADGLTTSILANSLWLEDGYIYNKETVDRLADSDYASVFQGDLGSEEMNQVLRDWINHQTGNLLQEQTEDLKLDPQTVLALASTIYYRAKWTAEFSENQNTQAQFHSPSGDKEVTYMNSTLTYGPYYWGEDFGAVALALEDGSRMWLVLPDEGKTPDQVLGSGYALDMILGDPYSYENQKSLKVHLSVPKFDVVADRKMNNSLQALGIADAFDSEKADFSACGAAKVEVLTV